MLLNQVLLVCNHSFHEIVQVSLINVVIAPVEVNTGKIKWSVLL